MESRSTAPEPFLPWARGLGDVGVDIGRGIQVAADDSIVVIGSFDGTIDLGGGPHSSAPSTSASFVAQFDKDGGFIRDRVIAANAYYYAQDLALDGDGNVIVVGFGDDATPNAELGSVLELGSDLSDQQLIEIDGPGNQGVWGVDVDSSGNVAIAGAFNTELTLSGNTYVAAPGELKGSWHGSHRR
jgi:hypothetical protein